MGIVIAYYDTYHVQITTGGKVTWNIVDSMAARGYKRLYSWYHLW